MSFPACTAPCRASCCFSIASTNRGVSSFTSFPASAFGFPRFTCVITISWTSSPVSLCPPSRYGSPKTANRKESLMKYLLKFEERCAAKIERSGGKGANLVLLTQGGFPVPTGFIVTAQAYRDFIGTSGASIVCTSQFPFHDPRGGVSVERRNSWEQQPAALCRDAAPPGAMVPM